VTVYLPPVQIALHGFSVWNGTTVLKHKYIHKNLLSITENCQYFVQYSRRTKSFQWCSHHPILVNLAVNCPGIKGPRKMLYYSNCLKTSKHWLSRTGLHSNEFPISKMTGCFLLSITYPPKKQINESDHLGLSTTLIVQFSLKYH